MSSFRRIASGLAMVVALGAVTAARADVIFQYEIDAEAPVLEYHNMPRDFRNFSVATPVRVTGFDVGIAMYHPALTPPTSGYRLEIYELGAASPFFSQDVSDLSELMYGPGSPYFWHLMHAEVAGPSLAPGDYQMVVHTGAVALIPLFAPNYATRLALYGEPAAVGAPEPGTWALMLLGFGGLGAALRSRRQALA